MTRTDLVSSDLDAKTPGPHQGNPASRKRDEGMIPTKQGKCVSCQRAYRWEGRLLVRDAYCPHCRLHLARTSYLFARPFLDERPLSREEAFGAKARSDTGNGQQGNPGDSAMTETQTKRLTEEEAWERGPGGDWTDRELHALGWDDRQGEIDAYREALKQSEDAMANAVALLRDSKWGNGETVRLTDKALAAARAVLEQGPDPDPWDDPAYVASIRDREAAIDALDRRDARNLRWAEREVYGQ